MTQRVPRHVALLGGAAVIGIIVLLVVVANLSDQGFFSKYLYFADALRAGKNIEGRIGDLSPGYLGTVTVLRSLGFSPAWIRGAQIGLLGVAAFLTALAAFRISGASGSAFALLFVLCNRAAIINSTEIEPETLILVLGAAALLIFTSSNLTFRLAALGGLLLGFSAVARPSAILAAFAVATALAFQRQRGRALAASVLITALLPPLAVATANYTITRTFAVMDPGTVFYEGMNPLATGYSGVQPLIVNDLERRVGSPDALHVTYRMVASAAAGRQVTRDQANDWWRQKAFTFMHTYPRAATALVARKFLFAVHGYDAYDLATMVQKARELASMPQASFALLLPLALVPLLLRRRLDALLPAYAFLVAYGVILIVFYVTARQRNAALPAIALLAAVGLSTLLKELPSTRAVVAGVAAATMIIVLTVEYRWQSEESHNWESTLRAARLQSIARQNPNRAAEANALAETHTARGDTPVPAELLRRAALERMKSVQTNAELFDIGAAFLKSGDNEAALKIFDQLGGYVPMRETRAVSSVAYYRAVALFRLKRDQAAEESLRKALREAPGNADVLALLATAPSPPGNARARLKTLHDPFTSELALARAHSIRGNAEAARTGLATLRARLPLWDRPALLMHELLSNAPRSGLDPQK